MFTSVPDVLLPDTLQSIIVLQLTIGDISQDGYGYVFFKKDYFSMGSILNNFSSLMKMREIQNTFEK